MIQASLSPVGLGTQPAMTEAQIYWRGSGEMKVWLCITSILFFVFLLPLSTIADHSEAFNCWAAEEKRSDPRLPCNEEQLLASRSGGLAVSHVFVSSSHLVLRSADSLQMSSLRFAMILVF